MSSSITLDLLSLVDMNLDSDFLSRMSLTFLSSCEYITSKFSPNLQKLKRNNKLVRGIKREKRVRSEARCHLSFIWSDWVTQLSLTAACGSPTFFHFSSPLDLLFPCVSTDANLTTLPWFRRPDQQITICLMGSATLLLGSTQFIEPFECLALGLPSVR